MRQTGWTVGDVVWGTHAMIKTKNKCWKRVKFGKGNKSDKTKKKEK